MTARSNHYASSLTYAREKSFFRHGLDHLRFLLKNLPLKHRDLSFCIQLFVPYLDKIQLKYSVK